ncbi:MAG: hypothetical protein Q8O01_01105, partial [Candidatus Omnitrophota bacterium]|nr:hypothetical protein [Candidatus Omnitrophota bacterium]
MIIAKQNKAWVRIISLAIVCLFIAYDLNWANPDLFTLPRNQDALSPALLTSIQSDRALIETAIQFYGRSIGFSELSNEETHLYPTVNGQRVDLFIEKRHPEASGQLTILGVCRGKKIIAKINTRNGLIEWTEKFDQSQLPSKPATDMAAQKSKEDKYIQIIKESEATLNTPGLESYAYRVAANALSIIARDNPNLIQPSTVQALEGILTKEGLESYAYRSAADALSYIARNNPNLIQPSTVQALEGILT